MSSVKKTRRMNAAVRACLNECYASDRPITALAMFIHSLHRQGGWRDAEIDEFETTMRRILRSVVSREPSRDPDHSTSASSPSLEIR